MPVTNYQACPGGQYIPLWCPTLEDAFAALDSFDVLPVNACIKVVRDFPNRSVTYRIPYHSTEIELLGDPDEHGLD